jgi:hypothetical protein
LHAHPAVRRTVETLQRFPLGCATLTHQRSAGENPWERSVARATGNRSRAF